MWLNHGSTTTYSVNRLSCQCQACFTIQQWHSPSLGVKNVQVRPGAKDGYGGRQTTAPTVHGRTTASTVVTHGFCSRLEYTGSAYEGVKVRRSDTDSDIEFDIMVILRCETDLQVVIRS